MLATGNVTTETKRQDSDPMHARADQAELLLAGKQDLLRTATLTGNVQVERNGSQPMRADAGRAILDFAGLNQLKKVHAAEGVHLSQHPAPNSASTGTSNPPQDFDLTAPVIDFFVADGRRLDHARTAGAAKMTISPTQASNPKTHASSSNSCYRWPL